jgi:hypothetical protein
LQARERIACLAVAKVENAAQLAGHLVHVKMPGGHIAVQKPGVDELKEYILRVLKKAAREVDVWGVQSGVTVEYVERRDGRLQHRIEPGLMEPTNDPSF